MRISTQLRLGAGSVLLLMGLVWMPSVASAAPGDSQPGNSGPSAPSSENSGGNSDSTCSALHRVAAGENLTGIAASYGVSVEELIEVNHLDDANIIVENQALCIPGGDSDSSGGPSRSYGEGPQENGYADQGGGNHKPGESYDPNQSYGPQENGEGPESRYGEGPQQDGSNESYGNQKPGESYDPNQSYNNQANGGPDSQYGEGPQQDSYSNQSYSNSKPDESYDPNQTYNNQSNSSGPDNRYADPSQSNGNQEPDCASQSNAKPGESYDPSYANGGQNSNCQQASQGYENQQNGEQNGNYGAPQQDSGELKPGQVRWSSVDDDDNGSNGYED